MYIYTVSPQSDVADSVDGTEFLKLDSSDPQSTYGASMKYTKCLANPASRQHFSLKIQLEGVRARSTYVESQYAEEKPAGDKGNHEPFQHNYEMTGANKLECA